MCYRMISGQIAPSCGLNILSLINYSHIGRIMEHFQVVLSGEVK